MTVNQITILVLRVSLLLRAEDYIQKFSIAWEFQKEEEKKEKTSCLKKE